MAAPNYSYPLTRMDGDTQLTYNNPPRIQNRSNVLGIGFRVTTDTLCGRDADGTEWTNDPTTLELAFCAGRVLMGFVRDGRATGNMISVTSPERFGPTPGDDYTRRNVTVGRAWVAQFAAGVEVGQ